MQTGARWNGNRWNVVTVTPRKLLAAAVPSQPTKAGCHSAKILWATLATPFLFFSFPCPFLQFADLLSTLLDVRLLRWDVSLHVGLHSTKVWSLSKRLLYCLFCQLTATWWYRPDTPPQISNVRSWMGHWSRHAASFCFSSLVSSATFRKIEESQFEESQLGDAIADVILAANY